MKQLFKWILRIIRMMINKPKRAIDDHTLNDLSQIIDYKEQISANSKFLRGLKNERCRYSTTKGFTIKPIQYVD